MLLITFGSQFVSPGDLNIWNSLVCCIRGLNSGQIYMPYPTAANYVICKFDIAMHAFHCNF